MLIKYDKQSDTKYIALLPEKAKKGVVVRTEKLEPWLLVDYDKKGNVFGIEILNVSQHSGILSITGADVKFFPKSSKIKRVSNLFHTNFKENTYLADFPLEVATG